MKNRVIHRITIFAILNFLTMAMFVFTANAQVNPSQVGTNLVESSFPIIKPPDGRLSGIGIQTDTISIDGAPYIPGTGIILAIGLRTINLPDIIFYFGRPAKPISDMPKNMDEVRHHEREQYTAGGIGSSQCSQAK